MPNVNERNSNIELLRIIAMIMIIAHHLIYYGVMQYYNPIIALNVYKQGTVMNKTLSQFLLSGGLIGVNIFFLIMGYFGIQSNRIKILPIIKDTVFYSILGLCIYIILGMNHIVELIDIKKKFINCINPLANSAYWFVSVYVLISLMKPVLNQFINNLSSGIKNVWYFILFMISYYSLVRYNSAPNLGIINGLLFYFLGAFIKINEAKLCKKQRKPIYFVLGIVGWLLNMAFNNVSWFGINSMNGLLSILGICVWGTISVVGISLFFLSDNILISKKINIIASSVFAVYLIHENTLLREVLWSNILHVESIQWKSPYFCVYAVASITVVFAFSIVFDLIRKKISAKLS